MITLLGLILVFSFKEACNGYKSPANGPCLCFLRPFPLSMQSTLDSNDLLKTLQVSFEEVVGFASGSLMEISQ